MATSTCSPIMAFARIGESAGPLECHRHQHPALAGHPHHRGHHGRGGGRGHHHHRYHQDLLEPDTMPGNGPLRHHLRAHGPGHYHHRGHGPGRGRGLGHRHHLGHRYLSPPGHGLFRHHGSPAHLNHHQRSVSPVTQALQQLRLHSRSLSPAAGASPRFKRASSVPPHHGRRHGSPSPRLGHHLMARAFHHGHPSPPPAFHAGPHHPGPAMRTASALGEVHPHHRGPFAAHRGRSRGHPHPHASACRPVPETETADSGTHPSSRVNCRRGGGRFGHRMRAMARSEEAQPEEGAVPPEAPVEEPQEKMVD